MVALASSRHPKKLAAFGRISKSRGRQRSQLCTLCKCALFTLNRKNALIKTGYTVQMNGMLTISQQIL